MKPTHKLSLEETGMKRTAGWTALGAVTLLALAAGGVTAKDPTIKEVMGKLHKGANAPLQQVKKDLQGGNPDWDEIQTITKEFVTLGTALGKNEPPTGDKASWDKLTK